MKNQINWDCTKEDYELINKIANRVIEKYNSFDKIDVSMDITAVHCNDVKLDLGKLLNFDDFNFDHDILGIMRHIDRSTGKLQDCFLPRCSI
jgi:hypothetical protein